jgi:regulatory protein
MAVLKKQLSKEEALQKLKHYCAYQERCHSDVKEKLFSLGIWKKDQEEVIATLIEEGYLNEERFSIAFAGGKWRVKRWGRVKIRYELKQRGISEYCIKKAMKEIEEEEYLEVLKKLVRERYNNLKGEGFLARKKKTLDYFIGRGFEADLVNSCLDRSDHGSKLK